MSFPNRNHGFSLVELLVVVLILAILMAVAMPAYKNHGTKVKRGEGKAVLMAATQAMERCYSRENNYKDCEDDVFPMFSDHNNYVVKPEVLEENKYKLVADLNTDLEMKPPPNQFRRDAASAGGCGHFWIEQDGSRGIQNQNLEVSDCW